MSTCTHRVWSSGDMDDCGAAVSNASRYCARHLALRITSQRQHVADREVELTHQRAALAELCLFSKENT